MPITLKGFARLTLDDLFVLRDALIHAEHAHKTDSKDDRNLRIKYRVLFSKLGDIIREEKGES